MYKILFTSALSPELKLVKSLIKETHNKSKIDFFLSEMWNYKTIFNLTKLFVEKEYDFVVNVWVCGFVKVAEAFQVSRIINISNNKELIVPTHFKFLKLESIACSEKIVYSKDELLWEYYVDMESYGFEFVCDNFKIPRIILKVPYDEIWSLETKNRDKDKLSEKISCIDFEKLVNDIIEFLDCYKKWNNDFSVYYSHYKFSFSEKLIFEKLYNRYATLVWDDFDSFFEQNKTLSKKEFLKSLSDIN